MGGGNIGLRKELNISIDNTSFNPSNDDSMAIVHVFADAGEFSYLVDELKDNPEKDKCSWLRYLSDVWRVN